MGDAPGARRCLFLAVLSSRRKEGELSSSLAGILPVAHDTMVVVCEKDKDSHPDVAGCTEQKVLQMGSGWHNQYMTPLGTLLTSLEIRCRKKLLVFYSSRHWTA